MQLVAKYLKLKCEHDGSCRIKCLSKFFNRYKISGYIRGYFIEIYNLNQQRPNISSHTVATIKLKNISNNCFSIRPKRGLSLLKIYGKTFFKTDDVILDQHIVIDTTEKTKFIDKLFEFEEITDKISEIWSSKYKKGILQISKNNITYFEQNSRWSLKKRKRFVIMSHLLCDIADYIEIYPIIQ